MKAPEPLLSDIFLRSAAGRGGAVRVALLVRVGRGTARRVQIPENPRFPFAFTPAFAQDVDPLTQPPFNTLTWEKGPKNVAIGPKASFKIPQGFVYLGEKDTALFMKMTGNVPQNNFYLIVENQP